MSSYTLENYIGDSKNKDFRGVFDLGSKSIRFLIAPNIEPNDLKNWDPFTWFHIGGFAKVELLRFYNPFSGKIDVTSEAFVEMINFIVSIKKSLNGILAEADFVLVGTEVFRIASNQKEVLKLIKDKTGFELTVLKKEAEAFLSLIALMHTYTYPSTKGTIADIENDDIILLFDQGGGSTEISYYELKKEKFGDLVSISALGTNALWNDFFKLADKENAIDPEKHQGQVSLQFKFVKSLIKERIDQEIDKHAGLKKISNSTIKLHAFAMGSSLKNALESKKIYGKRTNCVKIKKTEIDEILYSTTNEIESSYDSVSSLYHHINSKDKDAAILEDKLLMSNGLPAYLELLSLFKLDEILYSYFNLKHGVFIAKFFYGLNDLNITELPRKAELNKFDSRKVTMQPKSEEQTTVSILYTWEDGDEQKTWVKKLAVALKGKFNFNVLFDDQAKLGDHTRDFSDTLLAADAVCIIFTPALYKRYIEKKGIIYYELDSILTLRLNSNQRSPRLIGILQKGSVSESIPNAFQNSMWLELSMDDDIESALESNRDKFM